MRNRDKRIQVAFGRLLRKSREERAWTQAELSAVVNMEVNQISRLENGTNAPNLQTIVVLALALGKQPADLLKLDYNFETNTDFTVRPRKEKRPETTSVITKLVQSDFFRTPRSVADVIIHCKKQYHTALKSPATSGVLKKLRDAKVLKRTPSSVKGRFLYYK
ncbi:MAG TPA: helix-turn-helix transcriptional regulator [Chryseolinea sp.]|nr:helix-turn-helix transcriptional regulator [Chryseolinea sp.]